jgi:small subunit ribosomal protein S14
MAKLSKINMNNTRILLSCADKPKREKLSLSRDNSVAENFLLAMKSSKLRRNGSITRVRNRCELSGRPRGYIRHFGISRIAFRDLSVRGQIPGVLKSSW